MPQEFFEYVINITMKYAHLDNSLREAVITLADFGHFNTNFTARENLQDNN